ncbi:MAG: type 1 glutamine amidotransferase [Nitrospirae bacterium]|nr:type 1 glutamine amidotransferase [Nitrospirota bacterium]MBI3351673.1 type 1 glutamine amidotransferase [Nitrospirota bacterium]
MKVHVLQHVPFEGLGSIEAWLAETGADVQYTRFYESSELPNPRTVDVVVAMGGPMSVNDEREYPWLKQEKRFLQEAVRRGQSVVGVCLGAQLIASALGARVYANAEKEIGWFPIEAVDANGDVFRFPRQVPVFHWHGETFDLPPGAVRLAKSSVCENQAFQIGKNVIGLQFHLETTPRTADLLIRNCRGELGDGVYIQTEQAIRAATESAYAEINKLMGKVLSYITV